MVGIIVTGHGNFATGITTSVKLIAGGMPEKYEMVDFLSEETLEAELAAAMDRLSDCDSILVLADLVGGSPFNKSVVLSMGCEKQVVVVGGTNLGMIVSANLSREFIPDAKELAENVVNDGKDAISIFEIQQVEENEDEDGI